MDESQKPGTRTGEGTASPRLELSVPQVAGSALAAVAAAVFASKLGVYGTIIGAGVVSVIATSGGPLFQHLFRRTGDQIREVSVQVKPKARQVYDTESPPARGEFGGATTYGEPPRTARAYGAGSGPPSRPSSSSPSRWSPSPATSWPPART